MLSEASTCYSNALREDPSYIKAAEKWAPLAMELKTLKHIYLRTIIVASNPESPLKMELATTLIGWLKGNQEY